MPQHPGLFGYGGFFDRDRIDERGLFGFRGRFNDRNNPLTDADINKPHTIPPPGGETGLLIGEAGTKGINVHAREIEERRGFFEEGRDIAAEGQETTSRVINEGLAALIDLLPINPFTDEARLAAEGSIFGQISREQQQLLRSGRGAAASRGLSSGGGAGRATDVNIAAGRTRADVSSFLLNKQETGNIKANQFRAGLEAGLTVSEAQILASLTQTEAALTAGQATVGDPEFEANVIFDTLSAQIGVEQANALIDFLEDPANNLEPSFISQLLELIAGGAAITQGPLAALPFQGLATLTR